MPIEIKELLVEINVTDQQLSSTSTKGKNPQEALKDSLEEVLAVIENKKER